MKKLNLNESFISRIWLNPEYYEELFTTDNKKIEILSYGIPNFDSGADFKDALIKLDGKLLSGDIEIHKTFKDWKSHKHQKDFLYNKVILEVVFWDDESAPENFSINNRKIPTVILSKFLTSSIHNIWKDIINHPSEHFRIPCHNEISQISDDEKREWIADIGTARLIYRSERLKTELDDSNPSPGVYKDKTLWEKLFLIYTFEALGYSKNKSPFLNLGRNLDLIKFKKYSADFKNCEALIFGMSGFLVDDITDDFYLSLKNKWQDINQDLKIEEIHKSNWIFFKLRPKNFPTIRLAAASGILYETLNNDFLKRIIRCAKFSSNIIKDISSLFEDCIFSEYWKTHYDFNKKTSLNENILGRTRIYDIIINVIFPLLYLYSKIFKDDDLFIKIKSTYKTAKDKSKNNILEVMTSQLKFKPMNISESQGLIHLHNFYCVKGNCGECKIGEKVFDRFAVKEVLQIIFY